MSDEMGKLCEPIGRTCQALAHVSNGNAALLSARSENLAAWRGLAPRQHRTGGKDRLGRPRTDDPRA